MAFLIRGRGHHIHNAGPQCTKTRSALIQVPIPSFSSSQIPCCTCTIHKGYYIFLHPTPLQIVLLYPAHLTRGRRGRRGKGGTQLCQHWCFKATFYVMGFSDDCGVSTVKSFNCQSLSSSNDR